VPKRGAGCLRGGAGGAAPSVTAPSDSTARANVFAGQREVAMPALRANLDDAGIDQPREMIAGRRRREFGHAGELARGVGATIAERPQQCAAGSARRAGAAMSSRWAGSAASSLIMARFQTRTVAPKTGIRTFA
jgi:hypothetical protein